MDETRCEQQIIIVEFVWRQNHVKRQHVWFGEKTFLLGGHRLPFEWKDEKPPFVLLCNSRHATSSLSVGVAIVFRRTMDCGENAPYGRHAYQARQKLNTRMAHCSVNGEPHSVCGGSYHQCKTPAMETERSDTPFHRRPEEWCEYKNTMLIYGLAIQNYPFT